MNRVGKTLPHWSLRNKRVIMNHTRQVGKWQQVDDQTETRRLDPHRSLSWPSHTPTSGPYMPRPVSARPLTTLTVNNRSTPAGGARALIPFTADLTSLAHARGQTPAGKKTIYAPAHFGGDEKGRRGVNLTKTYVFRI